jgi:hypothetical protein
MNMVETKDEDSAHGKTIYFLGQNNCELLIQEIDGLLQRFSIILFGNYIEGDGDKTICVGEKIDQELIATPQGVRLFKPISRANNHLIENAVRFVDSVQGLSDNRKRNLIKFLSHSISDSQKERTETES